MTKASGGESALLCREGNLRFIARSRIQDRTAQIKMLKIERLQSFLRRLHGRQKNNRILGLGLYIAREIAMTPLDPQVKALLDQMAAAKQPAFHSQTPADARKAMGALLDVFGPGPAVHKVEDRKLPGPAGEIPVRPDAPRLRA